MCRVEVRNKREHEQLKVPEDEEQLQEVGQDRQVELENARKVRYIVFLTRF